MSVVGQEVLAENIVKFTKGFLEQVNIDMRKAADIVYKAVKVNTSLTDHSISELREMGNPYGKNTLSSVPHDPTWLVHKRTGMLQDAIYKGTNEASISDGGALRASAFVGVDQFLAPHAVHVIYGTNKMIPRDFLRGSLNDVADEVKETLSRSLNKVVISFNGKKVKL